MRFIATLATLTLACAGASPPPLTPARETPTPQTQPASPLASCPDCPTVTAPSCPDPPACPLLYSDTQGWFCIDDPATKDRRDFSYCWFKHGDCVRAYELLVKERPTLEPCRPQTPAYCYDKYSSLLQHRRSECAATMDHCERLRASEMEGVLPEDEYVFSPCTEQP